MFDTHSWGSKWHGSTSSRGGSYPKTWKFDNARQARTAAENRSLNMLIRIWKRIA
ncbi:MAG: hypothetical protein ACRCV0_01135 [Brevinema sp.]